MTTLQTARTMAKGKVQVSVGASVPISSALVREVIDSAGTVAGRLSDAEERSAPISEAEQQQAIETGLALLLFNPGVTTEISARWGALDNLDIGAKWAGPLLGLDAKYQILHQDAHGVDLSASAGYGYHLGYGGSAASVVYPILDFVQLEDYSQHDFNGALIVSGEWNEIFGAYFAARYVGSVISLDADIQKVEVESGEAHTELSNTMHMVMGTGGLMVGYRYVYLMTELTIAKVFFEPTVLGQRRDLGGFVVTPTLGLMVRFD